LTPTVLIPVVVPVTSIKVISVNATEAAVPASGETVNIAGWTDESLGSIRACRLAVDD
jgi:hypothetical protein